MKWRFWKESDGWHVTDAEGVEFEGFDTYGEVRAWAAAWAALNESDLWSVV